MAGALGRRKRPGVTGFGILGVLLSSRDLLSVILSPPLAKMLLPFLFLLSSL